MGKNNTKKKQHGVNSLMSEVFTSLERRVCQCLEISNSPIHNRRNMLSASPCEGKHTLSSNVSFVPPYSGMSTLSPRATFRGITLPSYRKTKKKRMYTSVVIMRFSSHLVPRTRTHGNHDGFVHFTLRFLGYHESAFRFLQVGLGCCVIAKLKRPHLVSTHCFW